MMSNDRFRHEFVPVGSDSLGLITDTVTGNEFFLHKGSGRAFLTKITDNDKSSDTITIVKFQPRMYNTPYGNETMYQVIDINGNEKLIKLFGTPGEIKETALPITATRIGDAWYTHGKSMIPNEDSMDKFMHEYKMSMVDPIVDSLVKRGGE